MASIAVSVYGESLALPAPSIVRTWHVVCAAHANDGPSGDVAFTFPLNSGRTAVVVIDVVGHGAARAELSSLIAEAITAALLRDPSPAAALGCAHERLRTFDDESPYAVAFVALVHPVFRTVVYASAGHDVAFRQADDGGLHHIAPTAPMLGIPLAINPCDAVFTLDPTETFVIATDGVTESRHAGSYRFFGAEGAACAVARALHDGANPARAVFDAACAHAGGYQHDDIGVLVVRIEAVSEDNGRTAARDEFHRHRSINAHVAAALPTAGTSAP